jgi:hypothetical protein
MGMSVTKTSDSAVVEVFAKIFEDVMGGLNLVISELKATTLFLPKGTILAVNETTRKANIVKTAELQANAADNATTYRVKKNHEFKVGDFLSGAVGSTAYAITAITTTETAYDTLTVGTTLGAAYTAGLIMFEAAAEAASNTSAYKYTAGGVLKNTVKVETNTDCSVVIRGTVYELRLPYKVNTAIKTALTSRIHFSQSY